MGVRDWGLGIGDPSLHTSHSAPPFFNNLLSFTELLRKAGLPVSLSQTMDLTQAYQLIDMGNREQVYHASRSILVNRQVDLATFDALFWLFWRSNNGGAQKQGQRTKKPKKKPEDQSAYAVFMAQKVQKEGEIEEVEDKDRSYSSVETLQQKSFAEMTPHELQAVRELMTKMRWQVSLRETRRRVGSKNGRYLHMSKVLRTAARHGGVPVKLFHQDRKVKQRPVILLADISGSMEKYARILLQFFYGVTHSLGQVESFVFGTRLTRITNELKTKNIDHALAKAGERVVDWSGGTRIGDSFKEFNLRWGRRVLRRGAIVVIVSDGWERGDADELAQQMRHLQRRAHRVIWLNPHLGSEDYRPLVGGIKAALPYIDDFMPIHNLGSLSDFAEHLAALE